MSKIDPQFQWDMFRFLFRSVRNADLERWLGLPAGTDPENSIQGSFERIFDRIEQLPLLLDPLFEDTNLDFLLAHVGWDGSPDVDFLSTISEQTKQKLILLSVPLWQRKSTSEGVIEALRLFTGKTVLLQSWFFFRWILDTTGFWKKGIGTDPWLVGNRYTEEDDELSFIIISRSGLNAADRELVYNLLTYIRPSGEHFGVIYAAFADDFGRGLGRWVIDDSVGLSQATDDFQLELAGGGIAISRDTASEIATWGPSQHTFMQSFFQTAGASIEMRGMRSLDGTRYYSAILFDSGLLRLTRDGAVIASTTIQMPTFGTPIGLELQVEPQDAATVRVTVRVGNVEHLEEDFLGAEAYDEPDGGIFLLGDGTSSFVDNVVVRATPNLVQFIGQKAITPTIGLGGNPEYIADPDPGVEEFVG